MAMGTMISLYTSGTLATAAHAAALIMAKTAEAAAAIATWIMNAALMVQVGLLTLGVGVIIAVSAAIWALNEAQRAAAESADKLANSLNGIGATDVSRGIQRTTGELQLARRGLG